MWIYSSCEAFNEEMEIDMQRLRNWLDHFGMTFVGGQDQEHDACFHVSGHASGGDLMEIARTIRPRKLIPVHTEHPEVYAETLGDKCEVVMPEVGVPILL